MNLPAACGPARLEVPVEDHDAVQKIARVLFGLTPIDSSEMKAATWALYRAAAIVPEHRRLAYAALPVASKRPR